MKDITTFTLLVFIAVGAYFVLRPAVQLLML
jgi:hypothetical protein